MTVSRSPLFVLTGGLAALALLAGCADADTTAAEQAKSTQAAVQVPAAQAPAKPAASALTGERAQAVGRAKSYISHSAFSRRGLIGQLEFEGYSAAQATAGVHAAGL